LNFTLCHETDFKLLSGALSKKAIRMKNPGETPCGHLCGTKPYKNLLSFLAKPLFYKLSVYDIGIYTPFPISHHQVKIIVSIANSILPFLSFWNIETACETTNIYKIL